MNLKKIIANPELIKKSLNKRNTNYNKQIDNIISKYTIYKQHLSKLEELNSIKNKSAKVFKLFIAKSTDDFNKSFIDMFGKDVLDKEKKNLTDVNSLNNLLKKLLKNNSDEINDLKKDIDLLDNEINSLCSHIPNVPRETIPQGNDEKDNILIKEINFDKNKGNHHIDIMGSDLLRDESIKLSGTRFLGLKGKSLSLHRAIANFFIDENKKAGFTELLVPSIINEESLKVTGQLPKFKEDLYKLENDDLYLSPTSEVQLMNIHRNEIIDQNKLPIRYTSLTKCYRREAGAAGKDTKGIIRLHEFTKAELVSLVKPGNENKELDIYIKHISNLLSKLKLSHRIVELCTGDLGFSAVKTYDIEVWFPSMNAYREVSSCSICENFQTMNAKIRYKEGSLKEFPYSLNGSSIAIERILAAIIENYNYEIPKVLEKYIF